MNSFIYWIDSHLILIYRMTGIPIVDFLIGPLLLAMLSVAIGEITVLILRRVNSSHMKKLDRELQNKHELSIEAKRAGDEDSYQALNREANDAFGRVFFNMFTFSAASLWAVFLALAWMQMRFREVEFQLPVSVPMFGESVGYVLIFVLLYILSRMMMSKLKVKLHERG